MPSQRPTQEFRQKEKSESGWDQCASNWGDNSQGSRWLVGAGAQRFPLADSGKWWKGLGRTRGTVWVRRVRVPWDCQDAVNQALGLGRLSFMLRTQDLASVGRWGVRGSQTPWVPPAARHPQLCHISRPHAPRVCRGGTAAQVVMRIRG